jgi:hypothetical protein
LEYVRDILWTLELLGDELKRALKICGAQGRTAPSQSNQRLSKRWDTRSSHTITMLSGAGVPPRAILLRRRQCLKMLIGLEGTHVYGG